MSKRLRKRIKELCGFEMLNRSERRLKAQSILDDSDFKQYLCNQMQGLSFRDIDRTMENVLNENQPTIEEQEEEELRKIAPQKFNPDTVSTTPNRKSTIKYEILTPEETLKLVMASEEPYVYKKPSLDMNYETWTEEEATSLVAGDYHPNKFKHRRKKKKG